MPESTEALIGVNATVLAVVLCARSGRSLCMEAVRQFLAPFPNLYERNGLILHS